MASYDILIFNWVKLCDGKCYKKSLVNSFHNFFLIQLINSYMEILCTEPCHHEDIFYVTWHNSEIDLIYAYTYLWSLVGWCYSLECNLTSFRIICVEKLTLLQHLNFIVSVSPKSKIAPFTVQSCTTFGKYDGLLTNCIKHANLDTPFSYIVSDHVELNQSTNLCFLYYFINHMYFDTFTVMCTLFCTR